MRSPRHCRRVPSSFRASSVAFAPRDRGSRTHLYRFFHRDRHRGRRHRARFVARAIVRSIPIPSGRIGLRGWARRRVAARHTATRDDARDDDARDVDDDARDRGGGRGARPARRSREGEDADADG